MEGRYPVQSDALADDVVIIGVGSIGLLCMMVARAAGPGQLIAVDTSAHARRQALELGATHAIDPTDGQAAQRIYDILPDGPDLVVEAAGPIQAVHASWSVSFAGERGGTFLASRRTSPSSWTEA